MKHPEDIKNAETKFTISGVVVPVFTPINEDSSVNYDVIPEYVEYLIKKDIKAILVGGTTGEAMSLSVNERKRLSECWIEAAKEYKLQVIVQVGGAPLPDVLDLAKHAEEILADAILTLPELYFKPKNAEELTDYLHTVSKAAPTRPLIYYHFPLMSGVNLDIKKFFKLASEKIPNFKGMKADMGVAMQVAEYLIEDRRIFIGNHLIGPSSLMGFESSIATVSNMLPKLVNDINQAVHNRDIVTTIALQKQMNTIVDAIASEGDWVPTMKAAMELVTGIKVGPPRRPLIAIDEHHKNNIKTYLSKNQFNGGF